MFAFGKAVRITVESADLPQSIRFAKECYPVLCFALEQMLTVYFHRGVLCQRHAKRKQLKPEDVKLGEALSNPEQTLKSLQDFQQQQKAAAEGSELLARAKKRKLVKANSAPKTPEPHSPRTPKVRAAEMPMEAVPPADVPVGLVPVADVPVA